MENNLRNLLKNIKKIETLYSSVQDLYLEKMLLKLAFLEFTGWIENYLDNIYLTTAQGDLQLQCEVQKYIQKCYSFDYEKIKGCLCFCVGANNCINIETQVPEIELQTFKSSLKTVKNKRDELAHNSVNEIVSPYMSFVELKKHIKIIYSGFQQIKNYLKQNNFI